VGLITVIDDILSDEMLDEFFYTGKALCLLRERGQYTSPTLRNKIEYAEGEEYDRGQQTVVFKKDSPLNKYYDLIVSDERVAHAIRGKGRQRTKINYISEPTEPPNDKVRYHKPHVDTFNSGVSCVFLY
jgi:hypothetical protein